MNKTIRNNIVLAFTMVITAIANAQRGQVHGSEWDDRGSTPIGNLLRIILVVGGIYWAIKSYQEHRKNKKKLMIIATFKHLFIKVV